MKILFDFRVYDYYTTGRGMGRYIYNLVNSILKNYPGVEISIIKNNEEEGTIFNYNNDKVKYYYFNKLDSYNFEQKFDFYFLDDILSTSYKKKIRPISLTIYILIKYWKFKKNSMYWV
ncbi:hypothetical protein EPJ67_09135 [Brachyspira aalborgi]|uniref:Uncharacterized protein n=1 Tax=Brachyspira aalborgi TaxID=29522 RepID=A0A5C8G1I3_9SPIR|nr:hypothetical protein [Brachyspira aalborgi]TXJ55721.1 hypothetical protein EPJ67_09135 [Brachyspira aalborgi]